MDQIQSTIYHWKLDMNRAQVVYAEKIYTNVWESSTKTRFGNEPVR